jgi:hypothetical protein
MPCGSHRINRGYAQKSPPRAQNPAAPEPKCRRIAVQTWHGRYSLSGDSIKANTRRGVFRVKIIDRPACLSRSDESCPSLGRKHEASHQKGGLGGACANAGGDGNARHRQRHLLRAVKPRALCVEALRSNPENIRSASLWIASELCSFISLLQNMEPAARRMAERSR